MNKINARKPISEILSGIAIALLTVSACGTQSGGPQGARNGAQCLTENWLVPTVSSSAHSDYHSIARHCETLAATDIRPSQSSVARHNAAQIYNAMAKTAADPEVQVRYYGQAASTASLVQLDKLLSGKSAEQERRIRFVYLSSLAGSKLDLGLLGSGVSGRYCGSQAQCFRSALGDIENRYNDVISDTLDDARSTYRNRAGRLQLKAAIAEANLVKLDNGGSVHLSLEKLRDISRKARSNGDEPLFQEALFHHAAIGEEHALRATQRREFDDAADYLERTIQFAERNSGDQVELGLLRNSLGVVQILEAEQRPNSQASLKQNDLCSAARTFQLQTSASNVAVRAAALRGYGLAQGKLVELGPSSCGASTDAALAGYDEAEAIDRGARLARAHRDMYAELLSKRARPRESNEVLRRPITPSQLDALIRYTPVTTIPAPTRPHPKPQGSSTEWPLSEGNLQARNFVKLARNFRASNRLDEAVAEYKNAATADANWPIALLEAGDLLGTLSRFDDARRSLDAAIRIAQGNSNKYGAALTHSYYISGRNELMRIERGLSPDISRMLDVSEKAASSSTDILYRRQACVAGLVAGLAPSAPAIAEKYCNQNRARTEDAVLFALGKVREMQLALRAYEADSRNLGKQDHFKRKADAVEGAFQVLLGRADRSNLVQLPISRGHFTVTDLATMGVYIGKACQEEYGSRTVVARPVIATFDEVTAFLKQIKADSCDGR